MNPSINHLIGEFMRLYEIWEANPATFVWQDLESLASDAAHAYNEGNGPSFHVLSFDGYPHGAFHERLLGYLLEAGFDPFMTVQTASGASFVPVFGHEGLSLASKTNAVSARMRETLQAIARRRFGGEGAAIGADELRCIVLLCYDSIPNDVLSRIAPEFVSSALA
jgi:hypothetical protein